MVPPLGADPEPNPALPARVKREVDTIDVPESCSMAVEASACGPADTAGLPGVEAAACPRVATGVEERRDAAAGAAEVGSAAAEQWRQLAEVAQADNAELRALLAASRAEEARLRSEVA